VQSLKYTYNTHSNQASKTNHSNYMERKKKMKIYWQFVHIQNLCPLHWLLPLLYINHCSHSHPFNHRCVNDVWNNGTQTITHTTSMNDELPIKHRITLLLLLLLLLHEKSNNNCWNPHYEIHIKFSTYTTTAATHTTYGMYSGTTDPGSTSPSH
jgi:hypothetical protein